MWRLILCCSAALGSHCFTAIGSSVVQGLMWPSAERICDGCMPFWRKWMRNRFVIFIAGLLRRWRHVCRCHPVGTQQKVRRMFLLDAQSLAGQFPGPNGLASQCGGPGILVPRTRFPYLRPSADRLGASSLCRVGRRASSVTRAVGDVVGFASVAGYKSSGH